MPDDSDKGRDVVCLTGASVLPSIFSAFPSAPPHETWSQQEEVRFYPVCSQYKQVRYPPCQRDSACPHLSQPTFLLKTVWEQRGHKGTRPPEYRGKKVGRRLSMPYSFSAPFPPSDAKSNSRIVAVQAFSSFWATGCLLPAMETHGKIPFVHRMSTS